MLEQLHQNRMRVETSLDLDDDTRAVMTIGQIERAGIPSLAVFTPSEIRSITFSGPTMYGSSVTTMACLRAVTCSICVAARVVSVPRPVA